MSEQKVINLDDSMTFKDEHTQEKHGLHGHVSIYRRNKETGETTFWYEADNIIPISGYQWILMKMFGLHLDSIHNNTPTGYEKLDQNTNVIVPDLNQDSKLRIGTAPENYSVMSEDISSSHIVQGFMIGNGGAGEDQMTAKNTDYSFMCLRNPIPFQQVPASQGLDPAVIGKYCGKYRANSTVNSYYIKRFDAIPHITHSWWTDGQRWDYVDPVTTDDLGPDAVNGVGKTNRIESYVECQLALDDTDCEAFFNRDGNTQTPAINELGLVAFDTTGDGTRTIMEKLYPTHIKPIIDVIFNNNRTNDDISYMENLVSEAVSKTADIVERIDDPRIGGLFGLLKDIDNGVYSKTVYKIKNLSIVDSMGSHVLGEGFLPGEENAKYNLFRIRWNNSQLSNGIFALKGANATISSRVQCVDDDTAFTVWDSTKFRGWYTIRDGKITIWDDSSQDVDHETLGENETTDIFIGDLDIEMIQPLKLLDGETQETVDPMPPGNMQVHIGVNDIEETVIPHPFKTYQELLSDDETNIGVEALYDRTGNYRRETDNYLDVIKSEAFSVLTVDEAQRIKLITYYTFKSIPIQTNWEILINYRIYAN